MTSRVRVLIAEDDESIRQSLQYLIEDEGYPAAVAVDGSDVLAYLRQAEGEPCVVLLDLVMPNLTGIEVLQAVAADPARFRRVCFIVVSARREPFSDEEEALLARLGVARVRKPFDISEILDAVGTAAALLAPEPAGQEPPPRSETGGMTAGS